MDTSERDTTWWNMITEWQADGADAAWMMYSANYLLRTGGLRWAIDPFLPSTRAGGAAPLHPAQDLRALSLVVLSHAHADHLDFKLLAALANQPLRWIIPQHMLAAVNARLRIPPEQVIVPENGESIQIGPLTLTAFDGLHILDQRGVPETGYLAEFNGKRWLFPGDTRVYQRAALPKFGALGGVFAHLWLGRACAALPVPPLVEEFSRFFIELNATRIVVTHLYELGRDETDLWELRHYRMAADCMARIDPTRGVARALTGEQVWL